MASPESTTAVHEGGFEVPPEGALAPPSEREARVGLHTGPGPVAAPPACAGNSLLARFSMPMPPALSPPISHATRPVARRELPRIDIPREATGLAQPVTVEPSPALTRALPNAMHNRVVDLLSAPQWHGATCDLEGGRMEVRYEIDRPAGISPPAPARIALTLDVRLTGATAGVLECMLVGGAGEVVPLPARSHLTFAAGVQVFVPQAAYNPAQLRAFESTPHLVRLHPPDGPPRRLYYTVASATEEGARAYCRCTLDLRHDAVLQAWVVRAVSARPWCEAGLQLRDDCRQWLSSDPGPGLPDAVIAQIEQALRCHREQAAQSSGVDLLPSEAGPRLILDRLFPNGDGFDKWSLELCFVPYDDAHVVAEVAVRRSPRRRSPAGVERLPREIEGWRNPMTHPDRGLSSRFTATSYAPTELSHGPDSAAASPGPTATQGPDR